MKRAYIRQDILSYNDYIKMNSNSGKILVLPHYLILLILILTNKKLTNIILIVF